MLSKALLLASALAVPGLIDHLAPLDDYPPPPRKDWERIDTTPRTGYYLDLPTGTLHHYDAATDTLTPTYEVALERRHVEVDVYARGEIPEPTTIPYPGYQMRCDMDFCIQLSVAIVGGDHDVAMRSTAIGDACKVPLVSHREGIDGMRVSDKVTYVVAQWGTNYCAPGHAQAAAYLDGVVADTDASRYSGVG